ncbi:hypothetical protein FWF48_03930 [Candidatus Saccharibacteria bacterium]|nr:hypothetical protein [Candidatus Saccharibacteria bacterium]
MKTSIFKPVPKATQDAFKQQLKSAVVEKDVEAAYKSIFQKYYGTTFPSPYGSDGYIESNQTNLLDEGLRLLLEAKWQLDLSKLSDRAKIVAQTIYYLKKFQQDASPLPNVIVGGDENEMFVVYAPKLYHYLDNNYDWNIAPSSACTQNEPLMRELLDDPNLDTYVFDVRSAAFDMNEVFHSIDVLSHQNGEFAKLKVDEANLRKVFDEFVRLVFGQDEWLTGVKKIGATEAVSIFIQSILGNPETYLVPTKKNILHLVGGKEIKIDGANYHAFFSRFDRHYSANEIKIITAVADRLIEELSRRFHGDFWTPTIWADRAIQMMTDDLGENWRDEYVVWDCAAGTKNLTRDYNFKNLFCSTLHQSEIDISAQYNKNATTFQYDFLNDDIDVSPNSNPQNLKMPKDLFEKLKNNAPIIFYTNPPYGQAYSGVGLHKAGIADTKIGAEMRKQDLGLASAELYTQFIYRAQKLSHDFNLTNVFFFFFNKGFLASPAFEKFTDQMLDQFKFNGGFMLNAGEFQGTSSAWGIIFSNFQIKRSATHVIPSAVEESFTHVIPSGVEGSFTHVIPSGVEGSLQKDSSTPLRSAQNDKGCQTEFKFSIEKSSSNGAEQIAEHTLRRVKKGEAINDWLREIRLPKEQYNNGKYPQLSGAFSVSSGTSKPRGVLYGKDCIGYLVKSGDTVQGSDRDMFLLSSAAHKGNGTPVTAENFERSCVNFSARKSALGGEMKEKNLMWVIDKDVFRRPSDKFQNSPDWPEFVRDCVIFSLFHRSSYQTSLRNFEYNGENYDVFNEWFFMPRDEIIKIAEKYDLNDIVFDAESSSERFVYKYLHDTPSGRTIELSDEARDLLKAGEDLVHATFAKRFLADQDKPEWNLMTWDAGYYQAYKIYTLYKSEFAKVYQELDAARTKLETKIRKAVYKDKILEK